MPAGRVRAFLGIGIRAAAVVGMAAGFGAAWNGDSGGDALMLGGLVVGGGLVAWDILGAPRSARNHNARLRNQRLGLQRLGRAVMPLFTGSRAGFSARVTF